MVKIDQRAQLGVRIIWMCGVYMLLPFAFHPIVHDASVYQTWKIFIFFFWFYSLSLFIRSPSSLLGIINSTLSRLFRPGCWRVWWQTWCTRSYQWCGMTKSESQMAWQSIKSNQIPAMPKREIWTWTWCIWAKSVGSWERWGVNMTTKREISINNKVTELIK